MRRILTVPVIVSCALALTTAVQWKARAYQSDFDAHPDEPAHVVSALLVRAYLVRGLSQNPLRFAQNYYDQYPKVAIGHWPPLFYGVEGVWMLAAGRSKAALLGFTSLTGAALVTGLFLWVRRDCGWLAALCAAVLLILTPLMSIALSTAMPDMFLGALAFWAATVWGRYLETGSRRAAILFVILALSSAATHGRGLVVALIPLVAGILTADSNRRRWQLGAISIPVVGILLAPNWFRPDGHFSAAILMGPANYLLRAAIQVGWPIAVLSLVGGLLTVTQRRERMRWVAMVSVVISGLIFHVLTNGPFEDRYLVTVAPAILALFALGWRVSVQRLSPLVSGNALPITALLLVSILGIAWNLRRWKEKPDLGYHALVNGPLPIARETRISLIGGDPLHEGSFIAEMALLDRHPEPMILRASKTLASSTWGLAEYRSTFSTPEDVNTYLGRSDVDLVIVQSSETRPHIRLLREAILRNPVQWTEVSGASVLKDARIFVRH